MFNPSEHLMQLKRGNATQDYLEVKWRLVWYREMCPEGTIETEEILVDLDRECTAEVSVWNAEKRRSEKVLKTAKGIARYKAIVTDGKGGRATAHGSESAVDFADFIEKAETKAIGRALAMLGYGTQFTGDELAEHHRIVDSPVDSQPSGESVSLDKIPVVSQLKVRCDELLGSGKWNDVQKKLFGQTFSDEDMTPERCLRMHRSFEITASRRAVPSDQKAS